MGMYTEWYVSGILSYDTPNDILKDIILVADHEMPIGIELSRCVGNCYNGGFYYIDLLCNDKKNVINANKIFICGSLKNYDGDIEKFLEYISPYIVNGYGEIQYEECVRSQKFVIFNGSLKYGEYHPPIY